jgi:hypothetical protein
VSGELAGTIRASGLDLSVAEIIRPRSVLLVVAISAFAADLAIGEVLDMRLVGRVVVALHQKSFRPMVTWRR